MQTTFLKSSILRSSPTLGKKSANELCKALDKKLSDEIISELLERKDAEFDFESCAQGLKALSKGSTRGKAMAFADGFRNKQNWIRLVERLSARVFELGPVSDHKLGTDKFVTISTALSRLRIGTVEKLCELPRDITGTVHLVRFAAEIDAPPGLLSIEELRLVFSKGRKIPPWLPAHLATSLAMLFKNKPSELLEPDLIELNGTLWRHLESNTSALSQRDLEDVSDALHVLVRENGPIKMSETLRTQIHQSASKHSRFLLGRRPSRLQEEVYSFLQRANTRNLVTIEKETADGVDLCAHLRKEPQGEVSQIAIQCYGPTHYVWDGSRLEGRTSFREFLLKNHSTKAYAKVEHVNHFEWERMTTEAKLSMATQMLKL